MPQERMESENYCTTDRAHRVHPCVVPAGPVRSEAQPWCVRDYDEQTGDLVGPE